MKRLQHYFVYLAVILSLVVLFKPGSDGPLPFLYADKLIHASTFALLVVGLWWRTLGWKRILVILIAYAISSELIQHFFIPGREFELLDIAADTMGVALMLVLIKVKLSLIVRRTKK